jgi:sn-glycerol 3-phosphate transport system permease protein
MSEHGVRAGKLGLHMLVMAVAVLTLFPLLWMVSTALMPADEVFSPGLHLLPTSPTFHNFSDAFAQQPVLRWVANSLLIASAITLCKLLISVPAAFAFAQLSFPGRDLLFGVVIGTMIVPDVVTIIPNYVLVSDLGWIDTPHGVVVPMAAFTGFYVFLLRQAMRTVPPGVVDAARLDGAGPWAVLIRVVLPLVRPAVAVCAVLSFLSAWNLYLWPQLVLQDVDEKTLTAGMNVFAVTADGGSAAWGPLMAAASLAIVPALALYAAGQRSIIAAFAQSGTRG